MFLSYVFVLVNESPNTEFLVERGLRKGVLFTLFLFVLVTEGLAGLIRKVVVQSDFSGFQVLERYSIEVLQLQMTLFFGRRRME